MLGLHPWEVAAGAVRAGGLTGWLQALEPFAFGVLGLHPWEVRRYTMRELGARIEGFREVQREERLRLAQLAVWLLGPHLQKGARVTARELLGLERREDL